MELDVVVPLGALGGDREHVRAGVHAGDRALGPDRLEQLGDVEARAAAHIEHAVARLRIECGADELAAAQHVTRPIQLLQPLGELLIELDLAHGASSSVAHTGPRVHRH